MAFMEIETCQGRYYLADNTHGETTLVPEDVVGSIDLDGGWNEDNEEWSDEVVRAFRDYVEGTVDESCDIRYVDNGWYGRYSAPGYMDCTDWTWADTEEELIAELKSMYGDEDEDDSEDEDESSHYEVIVENVGSVYSGESRDDAQAKYDSYLDYHPFGFDESVIVGVTMFQDGEIVAERIGNLSDDTDTD